MKAVIKGLGKAFISVLTSSLIIADGIMIRDLCWMAADILTEKRDEKKTKKQADTAKAA